MKREIEHWQKKDLISTQRIAQLELLVEELRANINNTTLQQNIMLEIDNDGETFVSETLVDSDNSDSDNESDYESGSDDGLSLFGKK